MDEKIFKTYDNYDKFKKSELSQIKKRRKSPLPDSKDASIHPLDKNNTLKDKSLLSRKTANRLSLSAAFKSFENIKKKNRTSDRSNSKKLDRSNSKKSALKDTIPTGMPNLINKSTLAMNKSNKIKISRGRALGATSKRGTSNQSKKSKSKSRSKDPHLRTVSSSNQYKDRDHHCHSRHGSLITGQGPSTHPENISINIKGTVKYDNSGHHGQLDRNHSRDEERLRAMEEQKELLAKDEKFLEAKKENLGNIYNSLCNVLEDDDSNSHIERMGIISKLFADYVKVFFRKLMVRHSSRLLIVGKRRARHRLIN
jgi:hypothetical protein